MPIYVLVAVGVNDQGVVGAFSGEEKAREAAEKIWPTTDGYHRFHIDVVEQDEAYPDVFWRGSEGAGQEDLYELRRYRYFNPDVAQIAVNDLTKTHDPAR